MSVPEISHNRAHCLHNNERKKAQGNFLYRPIKWLRAPGEHENLKIIFALFCAIFLSATIIGLVIVIPGVMEWNRQAKLIKKPRSKTKPKINKHKPQNPSAPQMLNPEDLQIQKEEFKKMLTQAVELYKKGEPIADQVKPYFVERQKDLDNWKEIEQQVDKIRHSSEVVVERYRAVGEENHTLDTPLDEIMKPYKNIDNVITLAKSPDTMVDYFCLNREIFPENLKQLQDAIKNYLNVFKSETRRLNAIITVNRLGQA